LLSLINPIWGVVNYLLIYQMNPVGTWWGKPISQFGVRYSLFAILFTMVGMVVSRKFVPKLQKWPSWWEVGAVLLVLIALANTVIGVDYNYRSRNAIDILWKLMVFVFVLARLVTTRNNLRLTIWSIVLGSLYLGYDAYTAPASSFAFGRLEQIGGADFATTSGFASHLSGMLPLVGVAFLTARTWRWRLVAAASGAFSVNAIIMCRTRSAFIGLMVGALAAFLLAPRVRRYRIHGVLIGGALIAFALTDAPFWERMSTLSSRKALSEDRAAETRINIWKTSLRVLSDYPLGIGLGNFPSVIGRYDYTLHKRATHNTVVVAFVELGIQGGTVFLLLVGGSMLFAFRSLRLADQSAQPVETKLIAYGMLVSCVTYFVTGLGTERFLAESFWWTLVLPLCLYRVVTGEIAAGAEARVPAHAREDESPVPQLAGTIASDF